MLIQVSAIQPLSDHSQDKQDSFGEKKLAYNHPAFIAAAMYQEPQFLTQTS